MSRGQTMSDEQVRQRIEDLEWMTAHGESLVGAARRLGLSPAGVECWLKTQGRADLTRVLRARNPRPLQNPAVIRWSA